MFNGNATPRIVHFDVHQQTVPTAANQNSSASRRVLDRIAQQVAEHGLQQSRIAQDRSLGLTESHIEPLLRCQDRMIATQPRQQRLQRNRNESLMPTDRSFTRSAST